MTMQVHFKDGALLIGIKVIALIPLIYALPATGEACCGSSSSARWRPAKPKNRHLSANVKRNWSLLSLLVGYSWHRRGGRSRVEEPGSRRKSRDGAPLRSEAGEVLCELVKYRVLAIMKAYYYREHSLSLI